MKTLLNMSRVLAAAAVLAVAGGCAPYSASYYGPGPQPVYAAGPGPGFLWPFWGGYGGGGGYYNNGYYNNGWGHRNYGYNNGYNNGWSGHRNYGYNNGWNGGYRGSAYHGYHGTAYHVSGPRGRSVTGYHTSRGGHGGVYKGVAVR